MVAKQTVPLVTPLPALSVKQTLLFRTDRVLVVEELIPPETVKQVAQQINSGPVLHVQLVHLSLSNAQNVPLLLVNVQHVLVPLYLPETLRASVPQELSWIGLPENALLVVLIVLLVPPTKAALSVKQTTLFEMGRVPVRGKLMPLETVYLAPQINSGQDNRVNYVHRLRNYAQNVPLLVVNVQHVLVPLYLTGTSRAFVPQELSWTRPTQNVLLAANIVPHVTLPAALNV